MKKSLIAALWLAVAAPLMVTSAQALQFAKAEDAIKYRQSAFQVIRGHFGALQPVIKGQVPYDKAAVAADVYVLDVVGQLPWKAFGPGTEGGNAKEEIWMDEDGFKKAQEKFQAALKNLTQAADSGDLAKLRAAVGETGASCKACHDSFRR
jgi:cytochrome c556